MAVTPAEFGVDDFAFPSAAGAVCDYPDEADVRNGVVFGDGAYTGTYVCGGSEVEGPLSPADLLRWVLVDMGVLAPPGSSPWPGFAASEPNAPDNCVTTYDTVGFDDGRIMYSGEKEGAFGVQVRIRSTTHPIGWSKALEIRNRMGEDIYDYSLTLGSDTYLVHAVSRISHITMLGKDTPVSKRHLFTINCVLTYKIVT